MIMVELISSGNVAVLIMLVIAGIDKHDQIIGEPRVMEKFRRLFAVDKLQAFFLHFGRKQFPLRVGTALAGNGVGLNRGGSVSYGGSGKIIPGKFQSARGQGIRSKRQ